MRTDQTHQPNREQAKKKEREREKTRATVRNNWTGEIRRNSLRSGLFSLSVGDEE
jgi:hypothetical protein